MRWTGPLVAAGAALLGALLGVALGGDGGMSARLDRLEQRLERSEKREEDPRLERMQAKLDALEARLAERSNGALPATPESCAPLTVVRADWFDSSERPEWLPAAAIQSDGSGHILASVGELRDDAPAFYARADKAFVLRAAGQRDIPAHAEQGLSERELYLRVSPADLGQMAADVPYALVAQNRSTPCRWEIARGLELIRRDQVQVAPP